MELKIDRPVQTIESPAVLRNKELDVLKIAAEKGSIFIVPQGSTPIINVGK